MVLHPHGVERGDPGAEYPLDRRAIQRIQPGATVAPLSHELGLLEQPEVPGDGRPADVERRGDLTGTSFAPFELLEDGPTGPIANSVEGGIGAGGACCHN